MHDENNSISQNRDLTELLELLSQDGHCDLDLIERSRRIVAFWVALGLDERQPDFLKIWSVDSQTDHLPKGSVRDYWDDEALAKADAESLEYEACFKGIFEDARRGMATYLAKNVRKN